MDIAKINLPDAVRLLREAMALNQVSFSVRLGKSLTMIQRYERGENIPARDLAAMANYAQQAGRSELFAIFRNALIDLLGPEVVDLVRAGDKDAEKATGQGPVDKRQRRSA